MQSSILTGSTPQVHGIVGNGWYEREQAEVRFWKQSNALVRGDKVWEQWKGNPSFSCANMFWWFNMHSSADWSCTPRPCYPADGRKIPDIYTQPASWREELKADLGEFPLFRFWGPATDISSSAWIAKATIKVMKEKFPTLCLCYLPHLDYVLQKQGPDGRDVSHHVEELLGWIDRLQAEANQLGYKTLILSEYGIEKVHTAFAPNRLLRQNGFLSLRNELDRELLDCGASRAFAVVDHQIAHVYVKEISDADQLSQLFLACPEVDKLWIGDARAEIHLNHERAGDIILRAAKGCWFSYPWWMSPEKAPDFARTVDIHRKPGYDPAELFIDPDIAWPRLKVALHLLKQKLGLRSLLEVIPLDASLVQGSHGRTDLSERDGPILLSGNIDFPDQPALNCREVHQLLLNLINR